jgi:DNA polymerase-3 subunit gamma/tau
MARQATAFGVARLSRTADLVVAALDEMTGATSPRLQLELLIARVLTHAGVSQGASPAAASTHMAAHAPATSAEPTSRAASTTAAPSVAAPAVAPPTVASPGVASPDTAKPGVAAPAVASPGRATPQPAAPIAAAPDTAPAGAPRTVAAPSVASPGAAPTAPSVASPSAPSVASPTAASVASPGVPTDEPAPDRATPPTDAPSDGDVPPPFDDDDAPPPVDDDEGAHVSAPVAQPAAPADPTATGASPATASPAPADTHPFDTAPTVDADDASPLEPIAPTPPVVPAGPLELSHVRDAWPEVLAQLEALSRTSWLVVSTASVVAFDDEVLTLGFRTGSDLTAFKTRSADGGPSEDLRRAIQSVLGVRVKYLARLDGDADPGGSGGAPQRSPAPGSDGGTRGASQGSAPRSSTSYASTSVTDWAVAPIPGAPTESTPTASVPAPGAPTASAPLAPAPSDPTSTASPSPGSETTSSVPSAATALAVDDEPEEAVARPVPRVAPPPFEGAVLPSGDIAPSVSAPDELDDDDVIPPPDDDADLPIPPVVVPRMAPLRGGVQRYGEAVVRQMLGATYVRDEPYEPPTRFS